MSNQANPIDLPTYLTPKEAAQYLRLSHRTLEKHRSDGSGPRYRKLGKIILYTVPDLDYWAELHKFYMPEATPRAPRGPLGPRGRR